VQHVANLDGIHALLQLVHRRCEPLHNALQFKEQTGNGEAFKRGVPVSERAYS
jgi:hypothetical protein